MNISNFLIAISSIGTFISSLIVVLTLFEMKHQRNISLKPLLVLKESNKFYI